ncbi:Kelch repeat-containing protein [Algoriphagus machipongonensis]|uniref:IPT/TIG domain-containing protein n=1 Tax=Algoriphagus machipongonensis TaxID=388413 RepID=A3HSJ1_9BACT|nr:hypothetical protein [Algoriphagus machipongonensis]EAZ82809.1 hypothetical protein ALPR1_11350 [Algoriphagus machipongonensis]
MLHRSLILIAFLAFFSACQQDEAITPREYPFIESKEIKNIDETGAIVDFEILKGGKSSIDSYGVEYLESSAFGNVYIPTEYLSFEIEGAPVENFISFKIKYDLLKGIEYYVKPFVKSNGMTIYGAPLLFESKGVKSPEISEVSVKEISGPTTFTIKGDYFSAVKERNFVHIPYIDEYFSVKVIEATPELLTVELSSYSSLIPVSDAAYDLVVTVFDKSTTLSSHFTLGYPKIQSINKLSAHVGEEIIVTLDKEYQHNLQLRLNNLYNEFTSTIPFVKITPTTYKATVPDYLSGKYELKLIGIGFVENFPEKFEINNSWDLITDFIQINNWKDYRTVSAGNRLVFWKNDLSKNYFLDPLTQGVTELPPFPGAKEERNGVLVYGNSKSELFVGLGYKQLPSGLEPFLDLWKLDLNTMQWLRMEDIPLSHGFLYRFFEYQDKIMAVSGIEKKYLILDPNLGTWQKTEFDVPEFMKSYTRMWVHQGYIYYLQEYSSYLVIKRFKPGQSHEIFGEFPSINAYGINGMKIIGNTFYLTYSSKNFSINMVTKEVKWYQSIYYYEDALTASGFWGEIEGKPYTLPISFENDYHQFRIYQLNTED